MNTTTQPEIESTWRNLKKGTLYKVLAIAHSIEGEFVVYIEADRQLRLEPMLYVRHTERIQLGSLYLRSQHKGCSWWIAWHDLPVFIDDKPAEGDAWARPLEMWHQKFERVEG